ncbi:hypothetical protein IKE_05986 [Bacillus cereus VD196]|uniref:Uncharacterized protein n=1 Tax=Bacillus cereus VD196 TaxID=1053243 RepID=A0A9W5PY87_BACCE|nr:hypothetical protein [Bacillus cereus]EJR89811.1 hypothetical protein IKG_05981 [Bacillus cereus VD200]EOO60385.1 hypothetical protein IKE_05986 [Bacillus cereus VD196]
MKKVCTRRRKAIEHIYTVTAEVQFINNDDIPEPYGWINIHQDGVCTTLWTQQEDGNKTPKVSKITASADIAAYTIPNQLCFSGDVQEYSYLNGTNILAFSTKKVCGTAHQTIKLSGKDKNHYVILKYQLKPKYAFTESPSISNLKYMDFNSKFF